MPAIRLSLSAWGVPARQLVELARDAESAGFDGLWVGDHVVQPIGHASAHPNSGGADLSHRPGRAIIDDATPLVDPLVALAAVASATTSLRLGTAVLVSALRHPLLVARAVATLQEVAAGRFRLGVGAGWLSEEFAALAAPFGTRGRDLDEQLAILRRAFAGGAFAHDGPRWRFDSVRITATRVDVPVFVGGNSAAALRRAATSGDGWIVSGTPSFEDTIRARRVIDARRVALGLTGPFSHIARIDAVEPALVEAYSAQGFDEVVLWADRIWRGDSPAERRDSLAAALRRLRGRKSPDSTPRGPIPPEESVEQWSHASAGPAGYALRVLNRSKGEQQMSSRTKTGAHGGIPIAAGGSVLRPLKAAEVVARNVVRTIRAESLRPGDSLPSEAEMLKQYGVSRESLREGLRLLEVQGMISIRRGPGGGPLVGTVDSANLGRMEALYYHLAGASYDELFEAWILAESTLARMAAANPDAVAREAAMKPYLSGDVAEAAHDDLDVYMSGHEGFHGALAALAENKVIQVTFRAYGQLVAHHFATVGDVRTIHEALVDDHLKLAQAVLGGDAQTAQTLMEEHLSKVLALNKEQLGDLIDGDVEWL